VEVIDREFSEYFAAQAHALRSTAYLLCGDWHRAEDIIQAAFLKLYMVWPRLSRRDALDGYAKRVVVRTFLHENRRLWRQREHVTDELPERELLGADVAQQLVIRAALAGVPPKQRAVLVLRFFDDLSVEETAAALGCSIGTVKSQSARGLAALRGRLGHHFVDLFGEGRQHA
jgi:RNA polymerase sigma-70 factor (sigma-E family)